ncbi:YwmB family TATA-box binding protein [Peribacillus sp. FSL M8-0224]|uniref:YwmB family TATA-box binding protein n=1 Tax=Peribacillus sp. FSL M8-0224 TaxID=2921568 RepID=UPI0030FC06AA|nr:YwmB family TATA-box binding protein [Brevibacterium sp. PAMC21349]
MKINAVAFLILFSFLIFTKGAYSQNFDVYHNLNDVLNVASENKIKVKEWRIYYRTIMENVEDDDLNRMVTTIKSDDSFTWSEEGNDIHHKTIKGVKETNQEEILFTFSVIKNGKLSDVSLSYQVTGDNRLGLNKIKDLYIPVQFKKVNPYITVVGKKGAQKLNQLEGNLLDSFSASYVEGVSERDFISVSALSSKFDERIHTKTGKSFNVQIGLRKSKNNNVQITMGTPIITTEY